MRAVGFTVIGFIYIFSISVGLVDVLLLEQINIRPVGLDGKTFDPEDLMKGSEDFQNLTNSTIGDTVINRIQNFIFTGYNAVWVVLELLSGVYAFNVLEMIGVPGAFIVAIKLIFPMLVAFQVIYFVMGRR